MGKILAICTSPKRGTVKTEVPSAVLTPEWGIVSDAHGGNWHRQVSLLSAEKIEAFRKKIWVDYGAFGENLVIEGFDFRSLDIPVRQLECCSGDLADLKVKSCDIEAWSPRQQKYFEVCSCSNLGDAQARRLKIRYRGEDGKTYLAHTLNNTCVAPPRMLIAFLENHLQADGTVTIPEVLRPYMGGKAVLVPNKK